MDKLEYYSMEDGETGEVKTLQISDPEAIKTDTAIAFTEADTKSNIESGENIPTLFGKIKKWISILINLGKPMVYKGTLGPGGTIEDLPTPSEENAGFTYKVIEDGIYGGVEVKNGDTVISDETEWTVIPSGDEPGGTVTKVDLSMPAGFSVTGNPITTKGTITVSMDSGYFIPTLAEKSKWDANLKEIEAEAGTHIGDTGTPSVTANTVDGKTTLTFDYLKGPKGDKGDKGDTGPQGPAGKDGTDGVDGKDGAQGPKGDKGDDGAPGPQGPKGDTGSVASVTTTGSGNAVTSVTMDATTKAVTATKGTEFVINSADSLNSVINKLTIGISTPTDNDYYISQYVGGGSTTTSYHRRSMSALFEYIKTKFGIKSRKTATSVTHTGWAGNATDDYIIPTMSFMAYWNGAYSSSGNSNLAYCNKGAFGDLVNDNAGSMPQMTSNDVEHNFKQSNFGDPWSGVGCALKVRGKLAVNELHVLDTYNTNVPAMQKTTIWPGVTTSFTVTGYSVYLFIASYQASGWQHMYIVHCNSTGDQVGSTKICGNYNWSFTRSGTTLTATITSPQSTYWLCSLIKLSGYPGY